MLIRNLLVDESFHCMHASISFRHLRVLSVIWNLSFRPSENQWQTFPMMLNSCVAIGLVDGKALRDAFGISLLSLSRPINEWNEQNINPISSGYTLNAQHLIMNHQYNLIGRDFNHYRQASSINVLFACSLNGALFRS